MAYKYNQLLKLNLQKDTEPDLSPVEAEISDLQQKKVTKFFSATDTLEDGEVAEYQGPDDAVNGLVNGYFYKKNASTTYNIVAGTQYFHYFGAQTLNINGYNFKPGNYYILEDNTPAEGSNFHEIWYNMCDTNEDYYFIGNVFDLQPGTYMWKRSTLSFIKVTSFSFPNVTLDNGDTIDVSSISKARFQNLYSCVSLDGKLVSIITTGFGLLIVHYTSNGNDFTLIDWFNPYPTSRGETLEDITINTYIFEQIDTQPPTPGVTVVNGVLQISLPVEFSGNITVHGSEVIVTTKQIQSENDFIKLRYNNPLALAAGKTSGISVNNYDGNDTDCILAVDKDGWARVGDSSGTLEKIATIEETPTDAQFVQYDAQNKQLKTAAIPEATTTAAGLMSDSDKQKLDNIDAQFIVYHQFNPLNASTIEEAIKKTIDNFFNANITTNILCCGTMFWQGIYRFEGYMYPYSVGICRFDFIPILNNGVGYVGRYNAGWHFNS